MCLIKRKLRLKLEKCMFHKNKVNFLKFIVKKIKIDSTKLKAIRN